MAVIAPHLRVVAPADPQRPDPHASGDDGAFEDVAVVATLFAISLLPLAGAAAHLGDWTQGELGLAAAGSLFAGRELWASATAALRARRRP